MTTSNVPKSPYQIFSDGLVAQFSNATSTPFFLIDPNGKKLAVGNDYPSNIIDGFYTTSAWSSGSAGVPTLAVSLDPQQGNILTITTDGTTNNHDIVRNYACRMDRGEVLSMVINPGADISLFNVAVSIADSSFTTTAIFVDDAVPGTGGGSIADYFAGSWKTVALSSANAVSFGGGATSSNLNDVRAVRLRCKTGSATSSTFVVGKLLHSCDRGGLRVIWGLDDCRINQYTNAFPILSDNGYIGTLAVPPDDLGTTISAYDNVTLMSKNQVAQLYALGWELIGHHQTSFDGNSAAQIQAKLDTFLSFCAANGYTRGRSHWVYPGGWFSVAAAAVVNRQFLSARRISSATGQNRFPKKKYFDPMQVGGMYLTQAVSLNTAKAYLDLVAAQGNGLASFVNHNILASYSAASEDWLTSDYEKLVGHARSLGFVSTTYDAEFGSLY